MQRLFVPLKCFFFHCISTVSRHDITKNEIFIVQSTVVSKLGINTINVHLKYSNTPLSATALRAVSL